MLCLTIQYGKGYEDSTNNYMQTSNLHGRYLPEKPDF